MSKLPNFTVYDDGDVDTNASANPHLNDLVAERYSRRQTLRGGLSAMTVAVFGSALLAGCDDDDDDRDMAVKAEVGAAVTVAAGKTVTLMGKPSNAVTVGWSQISGSPTVMLTGADSTTAKFVAPGVDTATTLGFRFTASNDGESATADTQVTINPVGLGFTAVAKNKLDVVTVPAGYSVTVLYRTGDPIDSGTPAYANDGSDAGFATRAGDHHDGMSYFGLAATGAMPSAAGNTRGLLVMNHENINQSYLHPAGATSPGGARPEAEALKEIECHGVSVIEIASSGGKWAYVPASSLNRRITPMTEMAINGPARGHALLKTLYSTDGTKARGTINNCANGTMPWNTYLTNEENWAGYFRRGAGDAANRDAAGAAKENASLSRYGVREGASGNYGWSTVTPADDASTVYRRWNVTADAATAADGTGDFRHEAFQFGWVVEIDPFDPASTPRKRTALGRMNHEGCQCGRAIAGVKPAFYMGDDATNEYIYKFVSNTAWSAGDANATDRLAIGDKYLDAGTLYVAKFNADGSGAWLPLLFGQNGLTPSSQVYPFADQADVLINARLAADILGATRMDRPEWTAINPATGEMYCTLTNNSSRTPAGGANPTDTANPRAYSDPKTTGGQTNGNANGHIIRLRENGDTTEATGFTWDIYAFGAGSDLDAANINLSGLDDTNDFSSPDGLWFGLPGNVTGQGAPLMWIETDDGAYTDVTNCMLLAAIPGKVGDGAARTITNTIGGLTGSQTTRVGKAPGGTLRRFLVGPKECEITGLHSTPDGKTLFVNIQHPGENGNPSNITSNWPASQTGGGGSARPRSATIAITRDDGGLVGI